MKKEILGAVVVCLVVLLTGCDDPEPSNFDVHSDDRWEIMAQGVLKEFHPVKDCPCVRHNGRGEWCRENYAFTVGDDVDPVIAGQIKNSGLIKTGQYGTLYKCDIGNHNRESWFQWVPSANQAYISEDAVAEEVFRKIMEQEKSKRVVSATPAITTSTIKIISDVEEEVSTAKWFRSDIYKPEVYKLVLLKLDDGIITTGRINVKGQWKLETDKNKMSGGRPITNVEEWKEFNTN